MANFFSNISNYFSSTNKTGKVNVVTGRKDIVRQTLINQFSDAKNPDVDLKKAELVSTVFTAIKILSENVSRLPLAITQDDGKNKQDLTGHKYYNLLKYNPQKYVNTKDWLTSIIACLYLRGNAYAYIDQGEFKVLNPDIIDLGFYKNDLWYFSEELSLPFRPSEILHFRLLTKDPLSKGLNPIESLKVELNIQFKSETTVEKFYANNSFSTKYLEQNIDLGKANNLKLAEIIENFNEKFSGYNNSGNLIVVPPAFSLKELRLSAADLNFLEAAKYSESSIGALFGIPQYLLRSENVTGKFEESAIYFYQNTLAALLNIITSELEFKLLTTDERNAGVSIEFDINTLLNTNITDKVNLMRTIAQQGALTPNEFRRKFNIPISDNPALDEFYIQSQYIKLQDVGKVPIMKPPVPDANQDNNSDNNKQ